MQNAVQFRNARRQVLRGVINRPDQPAGRRGVPGVVFFHGFTGDRLESHWLFVKCARALAERGFATLRFDFYGSGESDGDFRDAALATEISDGLCAVDFFRRQRGVDRGCIGLVGLSLGGAVAATIAQRVKAQALVLWSPVAHLGELRSAMAQAAALQCDSSHAAAPPGCVEYNAHAVSTNFFDLDGGDDPLSEIALFRQPTLVIHPEHDETVPVAAADDYIKASGARVKEKIIIPGADHTFSSLAWERDLIERTTTWFEARLTRSVTAARAGL
ncbi:MAG: alpha/beta hydrolase [Terriglobia bacterium]